MVRRFSYPAALSLFFVSALPFAAEGEVVTVGERHVPASEVRARLAALHPLQLADYGADPPEQVRQFVEREVVRDTLLELAAQEQKVDRDPAVIARIRRALSDATLRAVSARTGPASQVSEEDARKYYDEHKGRYHEPERVQVWRILCARRDEALELIEAVKKDPSVQNFTELARDHSLDKATYLRGGNLGFLTADGVSNEAPLRVDKAVVAAVLKVEDGALVPQPVLEGEHFGVVWRRGTVKAVSRPFAEAKDEIRQNLSRERSEQGSRALLAELRSKYVKDLDTTRVSDEKLSPPVEPVLRGTARPASPR